MGSATDTRIDGTRRWLRVTFVGPTGRHARWYGQVWRVGDHVHGERNEDAPGGIRRHVFLAHVDEVRKVEREDPRYGTWTMDGCAQPAPGSRGGF